VATHPGTSSRRRCITKDMSWQHLLRLWARKDRCKATDQASEAGVKGSGDPTPLYMLD
jgi:hypothetical protein